MFKRLGRAYALKSNFQSLYIRPNEHYRTIDGLRAFSMIYILLYHCLRFIAYGVEGKGDILPFALDTHWALGWIWNGDRAVDIFFVISGFLIASMLFHEKKKTRDIGLKRFYWRRILRLAPVYLFAIGLYWLAKGPNYENLWANLLHVNNFLPLTEQAMSWCWSLAVEEQFYFLMPLFLIFVFYRTEKRMLSLALLLLLSFAINYVVITNDDVMYNVSMMDLMFTKESMRHGFSVFYDNLYTRYGCFITGITAAYLRSFYHDELTEFFSNKAYNLAVSLIGLTIVFGLLFIPMQHLPFIENNTFKNIYVGASRQFFGIGLSALILVTLYPQNIARIINAFFSSKLWYPLAQLSYSMYVFHYVILGLVLVTFKAKLDSQQIDFTQDPYTWLFWVFVVTLIVTVFISTFVYLFIEKPFMNLRKAQESPEMFRGKKEA